MLSIQKRRTDFAQSQTLYHFLQDQGCTNRIDHCVHAWFAQRAPRDKGYHGASQIQASRHNCRVGISIGKIDNRIVRYILFGSVVEFVSYHHHASRYDPVGQDPVVCRQRYRDGGDKEVEYGGYESEFENAVKSQHVGCVCCKNPVPAPRMYTHANDTSNGDK